jgi:dephospho-CoA kinase
VSTGRKPPLVIALTGGIGSGKTAVSDRFAALGVPVIDTDLIAREVVEPGQPALDRLVEAFGEGVLDAGGNLDRRGLRDLVFSDAAARRQLEEILHPEIRELALRRIAGVESPYCIVVIPLLNSPDSFPGLDRVLVVDAERSARVERVMSRDNVSREQAATVIQAQINRDQRLAMADEVLENSGPLAELDGKVLELHRRFLKLAERA